MPIYEYRCALYAAINEFLVGMEQGDAEIKCQYCGSKELNRIFSKSHVPLSTKAGGLNKDKTCCGKNERCGKPPCADDRKCIR